jgi:hypothetical protein
LIDTKTLKSLDIKDPVVEATLSAFVSVNTFPLTKHLFAHEIHQFLAPHRAKYEPLERRRGIVNCVSLYRGKRLIGLER